MTDSESGGDSTSAGTSSSSGGSDKRIQALQEIVAELEISTATVQELRQLESYDIVFLCDDSGSMNELAPGTEGGDAFGKRRTRWQELRTTVEVVMRLAVGLDRDGVDVYFLNRPGVANVRNTSGVHALFKPSPKGFTPLTQAVKTIFQSRADDESKRLLLVIATDGEPHSRDGTDGTAVFRKALETRDTDNIFVSILACTDSEADIGYLNELDDVEHVDVTSDYAIERKEVLRANPGGSFTRGDYVAKALLGPVSEKWDNLDRTPSRRARAAAKGGAPARANAAPARNANSDGCCSVM